MQDPDATQQKNLYLPFRRWLPAPPTKADSGWATPVFAAHRLPPPAMRGTCVRATDSRVIRTAPMQRWATARRTVASLDTEVHTSFVGCARELMPPSRRRDGHEGWHRRLRCVVQSSASPGQPLSYESFVARAIGCRLSAVLNQCVIVGESLKAFALARCQPAHSHAMLRYRR